MAPFAGDGTFERTPGTRIANQGALVSAQVNDETDNLVDGLNGKANLDGKLPFTAVQTIVPGTAAAHAASVQQVQTRAVGHATAVAGTVDAIQVTFSPAKTTWTSGERFSWVSGGVNTVTAPTISRDAGSTTKIIKKGASAALVAGDTGASGYVCNGFYNGTDVILENPATVYATAASLLGRHTIWVPATAMVKNNGTAGPASAQFVAGSTTFNYLAFDPAADEDANFTVAMPKNWDEAANVTMQVYWLHPATTTNFAVVWTGFVKAYSNDDAMDGLSYSTIGTATDTGGTTSDLYISPEMAGTVVGSAAENDLLNFIVRRTGSSGSDTMAVDAYLIGVKIFYTTNALTDD